LSPVWKPGPKPLKSEIINNRINKTEIVELSYIFLE